MHDPCSPQKLGPKGRTQALVEYEVADVHPAVFSLHIALLAENFFLGRQLAVLQERNARPRRTTAAIRLAMVALARFFNWCDALVTVKPETFVRFHRSAFKMFWRWKSHKPRRPAPPKNLRELVRRMAVKTQHGARRESPMSCH